MSKWEWGYLYLKERCDLWRYFGAPRLFGGRKGACFVGDVVAGEEEGNQGGGLFRGFCRGCRRWMALLEFP